MNEDWKQRLLDAVGDYCDSILREDEPSQKHQELWDSVLEVVDEGVGGFEAMKRVLQAEVDLLKLSLAECRQRRRELQEEIDEIREAERDKHLDFKFDND